jgi:hypothetical protein
MLGAAYELTPLVWIKLLHTAIWFVLAGCILVIPIMGLLRHFRVAALLIGVVLVECLVLALNRLRCPLTDLASRYTSERAANFDIFLPVWLAQNNQTIFGMLYCAGALFVAYRYFSGKCQRRDGRKLAS